jgi:hypothetical protein
MEDKRALTQWNKSDVSYQNYIGYIEEKPNKFDLSIIDLFYIKNFKGGSATINEPKGIVKTKLVRYSNLLKQIGEKFSGKKLNELNDSEENELIELAKEGLDLVSPKNESKIDGFSTSFLTTLFHFYFPNLFPILDRRVLNGLNLISESDLDSQKQVKNIQSFYPKLIKEFRLKTVDKSIRELDKELFTVKFN